MRFLDQAKIFLKSGDGGAGAVSFRREKFIEFGGPDGGNGGRGGDIIFEVANGLNTLLDYRYQQHFKAPRGGHGMGRERTGARGSDVILKVPVGTTVLDEDGAELADLAWPGQRVVLLPGGDGGFGNAHFKSATNRAPRRSTPGWPGMERWVWLRLKLVADVGIIGLPNAGKSTFLAAVSAARPKVAPYPFTTLAPNLGVVRLSGERDLVLADIPGLVEGAHTGAGLGHRFLGHVERTSVLFHLVDGTAEDVLNDYRIVRSELTAYGAGLAGRVEIIGLNKCDALLPEDIDSRIESLRAALPGKLILAVSGVSGQGVDQALAALWSSVRAARPAAVVADAPETTDGYDLPPGNGEPPASDAGTYTPPVASSWQP